MLIKLRVLSEYNSVVDKASQLKELREFDRMAHHVHKVWNDCVRKRKEFYDLWDVMKVMLLLLHGQAGVERGFSLNRQVEVENLQKQSLVAQHIICDHISSVGGLKNVIITKELLLSASSV